MTAFNTKVFYDNVRKSIFSNRLNQMQVDGIQSILDSCVRNRVTDPHHVSNVLAQVTRETGKIMAPIKETVYASSKDKNPSDATVIKRLNTAYAKGQLGKVKTPYWRDGGFGRGQIQLTHLGVGGNYDKFGKILKRPLLTTPSLALDPIISADVAVIGMRDGIFRTKKLADYKFPKDLDNPQATNPRRIVNGNDGSDAEVAKYHRAYYDALIAAGWDSKQKADAANKINIHDGKYHVEVETVQKRLDELGYPEVGDWDGRWGNRTRAAVLAFRADNAMKLDPVIDDALLAALMTATPRAEVESRKEATIKDLRKVGAEDVKQADQLDISGYVLAGTGVVTGGGKLLDEVDKNSATLTRIADTLAPLVNFVQDNFWLLLIAGGAFVVWKSGVLKNIRLEKHQTGKDVSE